MTRRSFLQQAAVAAVGASLARAASPQRLLVLGGTGFLGRHVAEVALARGHQVTLLHRNPAHSLLYPQARHWLADREQAFPSLEGREFDFVIDTSGQKPRWLESSTRALNCPYLFVSTISVYEHSATALTEDSPLVAQAAVDLEKLIPETYAARKVACEEVVRRNCGSRGLIVRPCVIAGPYDGTDRFTYWAARMKRGGSVLAPHGPGEPLRWIDARDLVEWMLQALEGGLSGIYNLVGPAGGGNFGTFLRSLGEEGSELCWVSAEFLESCQVQPWVDLPLWVPSQSENAGFSLVSNRKALQAGLRLRPARQTAADTLAWRQTDPQPLRAGLTTDRERDLLEKWKARNS